MRERNGLYPEKWLLMLSGCAFVLLLIPAWVPGFLWGGVSAVLLCLAVWRLPISREKVRHLLVSPGCLGLSLVLLSGFGCNFYNTWLDSSYMGKLAGLLGLQVEVFLASGTCLGILAAMPAFSCALHWFLEAGKAEFAENKLPSSGEIPAGKAVWILFAVYAVGISAILRADFLYRDDFGRNFFGYKQWDYFSRYLSTALATLVHTGDYLVDIAPLPQLLAMLIMAASAVLLLRILYDRSRFFWWELAAVVPLGLNPYFLECVSYRFDAPYMAVSVLCGLVPLLYRSRNSWAYLPASAMGVLAVCTSYQAATGVFPMLVIVLAMRMLHRGDSLPNAAKFCLKSAVGYGLGLVFFKQVIMKPADAGYVTNSMPSLGNLIPNTLGNLKRYYLLIMSDFKPLWLALTVLLAVSFLIVTARGAKQKKGAALAASALALVLMALLCYGIYPVLASTIFAPRAMYGFGVLLAILAAIAVEGKGNVPARVPALVLAWAFFAFSFTYGNALNAQKEYTDFRVNLVLEDIHDMEIFQQEEVTVQLTGSIGLSPVIRNQPDNYGMLVRLMPETFGGGEDWAQYGFYYYYNLPNVCWDPSVDLTQMELPVLEETLYHTIRGEGNYVLIEIK